MVIKALYYILTVFIAVAFFLLVQDPYFTNIKKQDTTVATLEMDNVTDYEIRDDNIVRITTAKKIMRYKKKDTLKKAKMLLKKDDFNYSLSADSGLYENDIVTLSENVILTRSDGARFSTEKASYDVKKKIVYGNENFKVKSPKLNASGIGFSYDLNKSVINAKNIVALYEMEKKWE